MHLINGIQYNRYDRIRRLIIFSTRVYDVNIDNKPTLQYSTDGCPIIKKNLYAMKGNNEILDICLCFSMSFIIWL